MDCQAPDGLLNFFFDHIINEFGIILIYSLVVFQTDCRFWRAALPGSGLKLWRLRRHAAPVPSGRYIYVRTETLCQLQLWFREMMLQKLVVCRQQVQTSVKPYHSTCRVTGLTL